MSSPSEGNGDLRERTGQDLAEVYGRISDAFFALDDDWRFTHLNDRAHALINPEDRELVGKNVWDEFPAAVSREFRPKYERAMNEQETVSFEEYYPEPLDRWFEVRAYPSETGLSVYFQDITDRIEQERELQKREEALRDAYEIIADPDRSFDEKIRELLTLVRETVGTDYATLSRVDEAANEYLFEFVDAPEDADLEAGDTTLFDATNCEHAVSTERTLVLEDVEADAPHLADRAGNADWGISCYLGTPVTVGDDVYGTFCFYDMEARSEEFSEWQVTFVELLGKWVSYELDRERYERELEASNERLESFAYAVSHDLQEPLRTVSSHLSLIERHHADHLPEDGRELLEFAVDATGRMGNMIDGLLEYSRVETQGDPFEAVALDEVVSDVRDDLQRRIEESEAEITVASLPRVDGDADQLRQVFQNLLDNAIEYSGDEPPRIHVDAEKAGETYRISVRDEGIGIDGDDHDRAFEVFQRLDDDGETDGTGIGLALCERIVERHGGEISIDSDPGEGTVVAFTLSAANADS